MFADTLYVKHIGEPGSVDKWVRGKLVFSCSHG